ncbi:hypothetical protein FRC02_004151 [Tulasnella sp. 418]|nr:hypothetical protein FRC02_004151 [Tulasnella sp. 418]
MSAFMAHTPHSHPWFATNPKRKRFEYDYNGSVVEGGEYGHLAIHPSHRQLVNRKGGSGQGVGIGGDEGSLPERAIKRIRRGEVETGFASMSLNEVEMDDSGNLASVGQPSFQGTDESWSRPNSASEQLEPRTPPEVPEVKMKRRTWFEPEKDRIVVLDLTGSDTESEVDTPKRVCTPPTSSQPESSPIEYKISKTYLSRLSNSLGLDLMDRAMPSHDSNPGALVLYKPLQFTLQQEPHQESPEEAEGRSSSPELFASIEEVVDDTPNDMAMEID